MKQQKEVTLQLNSTKELLLERAAYSKEENRIKRYKNKSQNKNPVRIKPLAISVIVLLVCMSSLSFLFTDVLRFKPNI